jgi:hypothetical protein
MSLHLQKAKNTFIPDVRKIYERTQPYATVNPKMYQEERQKHIFDPLELLEKKVGLISGPEHKTTTEFKNKKGEFETRPMTWQVMTSKKFPKAHIYRWKIEGESAGHRIVVIERPESNTAEIYNSTGGYTSKDIPPELYDIVSGMTSKRAVSFGKYRHQEKADTCGFHTISRACFHHLTDEQYNDMIKARSAELKINTDQAVYASAIETGKKGATEEEKPPQSLKKGGVVTKMPKSVPVPIIAHSGELVVPVDTVQDVLNSNAWHKHVKKIARANKVSLKDAFQMSLGLHLEKGKWQ